MLVSILALGGARAAELGEARVSSHIGQALVADLELALIDDPAHAVAVRLASPEVYSGAGLAVPPVLSSLNLSVMRRDGRQFLHVTSLRPVDSEHLHLYLELTDKGQRSVRLATLWLTPDPNPAPPPAAPVVVPVASTKEAAPPPAPVATRKPPSAPGPVDEGAHRHADLAPRRPVAAPPTLPIHVRHAAPAAPVACVRQAEAVSACAALDGKQAALKEKIGILESKVKLLQATLSTAAAENATSGAPGASAGHAPAVGHGAAAAQAPAAAHAAAAGEAPVAEPAQAAGSASASEQMPGSARPSGVEPAAAKAPPGPKPISAIKPLVPRKPKTPPPAPESGLPWGWICGGLVLLALGGMALLWRHRARAVPRGDLPAAPRLIDRLRERLAPAAPQKAEAAVAEAVEPSLD